MKKLFYASFFCINLLMIACVEEVKMEQPIFSRTTVANINEKQTASNLSLPISIDVKEIERFLAQELPKGKTLFSDNNLKVSSFAKVDIKVTSLDKIKVYTQDNKVALKLKANIYLKGKSIKFIKNINKSDNVKTTVIALVTPKFDANWNFKPILETKIVDYEALEIKIAGIKVKLDKFVINELEKQMDKAIKPALLKLAKQKFDLRKKVLKLWNNLDPLINIATEPVNSNIVLQKPVSFNLAPIIAENNFLKLNFNLKTDIKSVIGNVANVESLGALPSLQNRINQSDQFSVFLPSSVSFSSINKYLNENIKSHTVNAKDRKVVLSDFEIGGLNEKQIWIKTNFKSDDISGNFYLYATPELNNRNKTIRLTNLKYNLESESWLLKSASYLFDDAIIKTLSEKLMYNFSKDLNDLIKKANQQYLNNYNISGLEIKGKVQNVMVEDLIISKDYISVFPLATGNVKVKVKSLDFK